MLRSSSRSAVHEGWGKEERREGSKKPTMMLGRYKYVAGQRPPGRVGRIIVSGSSNKVGRRTGRQAG